MGTINFVDGSIYVGEFKDGKMHGKEFLHGQTVIRTMANFRRARSVGTAFSYMLRDLGMKGPFLTIKSME